MLLNEGEVAKEHPVYKGYFFTTEGRCYSQRLGRFLICNTAKGQPYVMVTINRQRKLLHRCLAETFIPNPLSLPEVRHLDDDKENFSLSNLAWGTQSDNWGDAKRNGRRSSHSQDKVKARHKRYSSKEVNKQRKLEWQRKMRAELRAQKLL